MHHDSTPPIPTPTTYQDDARVSEMLRQSALANAKRDFDQQRYLDTGSAYGATVQAAYGAAVRQANIDHLLRCKTSAMVRGMDIAGFLSALSDLRYVG